MGVDRESAEKSALGALVAVFGQNVTGETLVTSRYSEAMASGVLSVSEGSSMDQAIRSSYDLQTLVGAEIKDTWFDGAKTTYAVAVMDRAKATVLYSDLLETNERNIKNLMAVPESEKYTIDSYARFDLAAAVADTNNQFLNLLSVINPAAAQAKRASVTRGGDAIRLEMVKMAQNIPISIAIENDRDGRLKSAFSSVFNAAGFKTTATGGRYILAGTFSLSEAVLSGNPNKFVRYIVDVRLTDSKTGTVLLPFSISGREGHTSVPEAENRAIRAAEQSIKDQYAKDFGGLLARLTSKK
jgi:hypothetical protein